MSYAKLFSSITESSLWCEPKEVRLLFVSMLARADAAGFVEAAKPGLAKLANLSIAEIEIALESLEGPDPHSKNPDNDGRRILKVPGGWMLLNYEGYRNRQSDDERREYMRDYMRKYRKGRKQSVNCGKPPDANSKESPSASASPYSSNEKGEAENLPFTSERFRKAWADWQDHREEIKKPLKPTQAEKQLKMLSELGEDRAVAMIEYTITKGWQGLREDDSFQLQNGRGSSAEDPRGNIATAKRALERLQDA